MAFHLFLLSFASFVSSSHAFKKIETWNTLYQNDASVYFVSNDHLTNAYEKYLSHIKAVDYRHLNARHPFLIQFPSNCGISCHSKIKKIVGSANHNFISPDFAHLFIDQSSLATLQRSHPQVILDYVPMLPALKIEKSTNEFIATCKASQSPDPIPLTLSVTFAPLTTSDILYLSNLFKTFPSSVQIQLDTPLQTNREIHFSIHLDCHDATKVISIFSSLPYTLWIERRLAFKTLNRWARGLCQSGRDTSTPMYEVNITGEGYIVGISDSGIDMTHCHFYDPEHAVPYDTVNMQHRKVIYYNKYVDGLDDSEGHGTHVSSTVAGRSYLDYGDYSSYNGNAYRAKIAFFDLGNAASAKNDKSLTPPSDINSNLLQVMYDVGARVFSNSWGSSDYGKYTVQSRAVDAFMRNNPDALVLFAAGNDGDSGSSTVGPPATNKNGVCVGATMSTTDSFRAVMGPNVDGKYYSEQFMAGFSSQGPTSDGRLKPDITAPGWFINAAQAIGGAENGHCEVQHMRGTSMATPTVAGNAVLIKQYFQDGWYPSGSRNPVDSFVPSGALLKAMLIQSGVSMDYVTYDNDNGLYQQSTGGYPSNIQGFGKVRLSNILNFGPSSASPITLFVRGAAETSSPYYASIDTVSQVDTYLFLTSSASTQPQIRVTLAFTDEIGAVGSSVTLVNNLVINVTEGGTSRTYAPYLEEDLGLNNVVMVDIPTPLSNTNYTVTVTARVLNSAQPYALVITGEITAAQWNTTSTSESSSLSESITKSMRNTIAILCLVIVLFGALLTLITYQLRQALRRMEETYDEDEDDAHSYHTRRSRQSTVRGGGRRAAAEGSDIEHRELTEREIQMISSRR